jgi:N-acetylgalactosamine kinase
LFVAIAEGCSFLNGIDISPENFVDFCGQGEQYVGTRGGSSDHAAIKYSRKGAVTHIGFSPLKKHKVFPFPDNYALAVCNSKYQANKTGAVKDVYNQRVACYHIGLELLKRKFPETCGRFEYVRDIVYHEKAPFEKEIFSMLKTLPVNISRQNLLEMDISEELKMRVEELSEKINSFPVRGVFLYGLAECLRSRLCSGLLQEGQVKEFGKWMNISHNGDRVSRWQGDACKMFSNDYSDRVIEKFMQKPAGKKKSILIYQPGSYRCSTKEIDKMVDISLSVKAAAGAQIAGAGLGGCIMVLLAENAYRQLQDALLENYYQQYNLEPEMFISYPSEGSGIVCF